MLESKRGFLFLAFAILSFLLYQAWQKDYAPEPVKAANNEVVNLTTNNVNGDQLISITTDLMVFKLDPVGGDLVYAEALDYDLRLNNPEQKVVLFDYRDRTYYAKSKVLSKNNEIGFNSNGLRFVADKKQYSLGEKEVLTVRLSASESGVNFSKIYTFKRGEYLIDVDYEVFSSLEKEQNFDFIASLIRDQNETGLEEKGAFGMKPFIGVAYSPEDEVYEKADFSDLEDEPVEEIRTGGWIGYIQHYFVSAWIPNQLYKIEIKAFNSSESNLDKLESDSSGLTTIQYRSLLKVKPQETFKFSSGLYIGPKLLEQMETAAPGLNKTMDLSWVWWIGLPLYKMLTFFFGFLGNWGLAIIAITIVVKTILYPLSKAQYKSAHAMRKLQPKMQRLKERYGEDKQRMQQEMMKMYKEEKANPFGGCLPMLLQFPIFIALYYVLFEAVELRHAPFFGWINDLSVQDPYFVLPLLMGASMFLMQKMQPVSPTMDPMQQKMMQYLPVFFTVFMLFFPAGLVLYWLCNNLISITQQQYVNKKIEKQEALGKNEAKSKSKKKG